MAQKKINKLIIKNREKKNQIAVRVNIQELNKNDEEIHRDKPL